jgi:hypothetical protein
MEEVSVHAGHKVLVEVSDNILLIVFYPQGILDQKLRPRPIHLLNIVIILFSYLKLYIIKTLKYSSFSICPWKKLFC